jgi:hypothetical protein
MIQVNLLVWLSIQVLCARYSDEEFFQIRCKGNLFDGIVDLRV